MSVKRLSPEQGASWTPPEVGLMEDHDIPRQYEKVLAEKRANSPPETLAVLDLLEKRSLQVISTSALGIGVALYTSQKPEESQYKTYGDFNRAITSEFKAIIDAALVDRSSSGKITYVVSSGVTNPPEKTLTGKKREIILIRMLKDKS
jgi:hypothetical protein